MNTTRLPNRVDLTIAFAHAAYQLASRFAERKSGIGHFEVRTLDALKARIHDADVLVVSGLWRNELLELAPRLRFVQSISSGMDQYDQAEFRARGIRLASAAGVNANAVAEHAMSLVLALNRQLHLARDNQTARHWRPMIAEIAKREAEIAGKTLVVVGLGRIGERIATLGRAFGMHVIGLRRAGGEPPPCCHELKAMSELNAVLPRADVLVLSCALTPDTTRLLDGRRLNLMKPTAQLVNVARGKVVDEAALIEALVLRRIAAAALDVFEEEPLPVSSPLWAMANVLVTPHTGGETQAYEDNVIDILVENLEQQWRGEAGLRNQVV